MKKSVVLTFLIAIAVQPLVGCCNCTWPPSPNPHPTPNPTPPPPGSPVLVDPNYSSQKFAVLATNLKAEVEDNQVESDFWYDLVLTYCTLLDHGFKEEDIYVLYGAGTDAAFSQYPAYGSDMCGVSGLKLTDYKLQNSGGMAKDQLCNVLCCLSSGRPATMNANERCDCLSDSNTGIDGFKCSQPGVAKLRPDDFLFVWVKGHGRTNSCNTTLRFTPNPHLHDFEVKGLLEGLDSKHRVLVFETCDAGGWLDDLESAQTVVAVSSGNPDETQSDCQEKAWAAIYNELPGDGGGVFHGRFTHGFNAALRHVGSAPEPVDADDNNLVSIQEGFDEAKIRIDAENALIETDPAAVKYGTKMHPAIRIPDEISSCLFIRLPNPGVDHEVFTRDGEADNATIPSTTEVNPPDLWVSADPKCEPEAELVQTGTGHHLCARVHNIGCADPGPVTVTFYVELCGDPGSAVELTGSIPKLQPATSEVVAASWAAVTTAGKYCVRAELIAGSDLPAGGLTVENDNNQAEMEVIVN